MTISSSKLPDDVQVLLREHIECFEELHLLLLLVTERREWSVQELMSRLRLSQPSVATALASLLSHGLVSLAAPAGHSSPSYRYASGAHDLAVATLARVYHDHPIAVMRLMGTLSIERIRADAMRAFVDAFLFRKGK